MTVTAMPARNNSARQPEDTGMDGGGSGLSATHEWLVLERPGTYHDSTYHCAGGVRELYTAVLRRLVERGYRRVFAAARVWAVKKPSMLYAVHGWFATVKLWTNRPPGVSPDLKER
jgi:hypothetical protein